MKRLLTKVQGEIWHIAADKRIDGPPPDVCGNLSGVRGDLTGVCGNLTDVYGNLSGVRGNLTDVCGNLDECEITNADRARGVEITELIQ